MKDIAFRAKELAVWERTFPQASSVPLSGVGHFVQEEAPADLASAVTRFLSEAESDRRFAARPRPVRAA